MAYKEFGATIAPANKSDTGFPIAMGSHIGGGRTINDKSNLELWQLLGDGADITEQKANAIGQIWYDRSDSKYYKLTGFTGDTPNWVEFLDIANINGTSNYVPKFTGVHNIGNSLIYDDGTNVGIGTATPSEKLEVNGNIKVAGNINLSGNHVKNGGFEVVSSLPTNTNNNFVGRQVTYQGRSYIWDGGSWVTPNDVYEANLKWGGRNISGDYSPIDAAMVDELGANRLAFANPAGITIEYSTDGGDTWLDYGASDSIKRALTATASSLVIGKSTSNLTASPLNMLRVTFDTGVCQVYTTLNKIVLYVSSNGSTGNFVTIQKALQSSPNNYIDHVTNVPISGWSGYNVINIPSLTTYGNTSASQYGRLRFIFGCTGYNGTSSGHPGLTIISIKGFGGVGWVTPSNMAKRNSLFTYDGFQNAYFPASVQSNESINFDTNNIEPTQSGTVTKTSTWLWQYLTQSVNFLWLKLKDLFPSTQATTHNYLPKVDNSLKKLVKSNIQDDGTTPKYGANIIWHSGNDGSSSGLDADLLDGIDSSGFQKIRPFGHNYNNIHSAYYSNNQLGYYRITLPNAQLNMWCMLYMELSVKQNYRTGEGGKIIINALHNSTSPEWFNFSATTIGNLSTAIKVYASEGKYFYVEGISTHSNVSVDKLLVGDAAINVDFSSIIVDSVSSLPSVYQTAVMSYMALQNGTYPEMSVGKLDGKDSTDFSLAGHTHDYSASNHNHDTTYLGLTAQAVDSAKLGGELPSYYEPAFNKNTAFNKSFGTGSNDVASGDHNHDNTYLGINATAADSDKLDGYHASDFAPSTHTHDIMTGASASTNGEVGLVPKPLSGQQEAFLRGDGTYGLPNADVVASASYIRGTLSPQSPQLSCNAVAGGNVEISLPYSYVARDAFADAVDIVRVMRNGLELVEGEDFTIERGIGDERKKITLIDYPLHTDDIILVRYKTSIGVYGSVFQETIDNAIIVTNNANTAAQRAEDAADREILLSESEYELLVQNDAVDLTKKYLIYEDDY